MPQRIASCLVLLFGFNEVIVQGCTELPLVDEIIRKITTTEEPVVQPGESGPISDGCNLCVWGHCNPGIKGVKDAELSVVAHADKLLKSLPNCAIVNLDKYREPLINAMTTYSENQRRLISSQLSIEGHGTLDKLMTDRMKKSYRFSQLMIALSQPLPRFLAAEFDKAISDQKDYGPKSTGRILMLEMFLTYPNCLIKKTRLAYDEMKNSKDKFVTDIENSLKQSGKFDQEEYINVFKTLALGKRSDEVEPFWFEALVDARMMRRAYDVGTVKDMKKLYSEIFTQRPIPQLKMTFQIYERLRAVEKNVINLEDDINSRMKTDPVKEMYFHMVKIIKHQHNYFANKFNDLFESPSKVPVVTDRFIGLLRGRADIDLDDIKDAYQKSFKKSLASSFENWDMKKAKPNRKHQFRRSVLRILGEDYKEGILGKKLKGKKVTQVEKTKINQQEKEGNNPKK